MLKIEEMLSKWEKMIEGKKKMLTIYLFHNVMLIETDDPSTCQRFDIFLFYYFISIPMQFLGPSPKDR